LCRLISLKFSIPAEAEIEKPNGFWLVSLDCQRAGHPRPAGRTTDEPQSYRNISFMSTLNLPLKFSRSVEIFRLCEFLSILPFPLYFRFSHRSLFSRPPLASSQFPALLSPHFLLAAATLPKYAPRPARRPEFLRKFREGFRNLLPYFGVSSGCLLFS